MNTETHSEDLLPLHLRGLIQPHGILLALSATDLVVQQVSQNVWQELGVKAEELLGRSLSTLLSPHQTETLQQLRSTTPESPYALQLYLRTAAADEQPFVAIAHHRDQTLILELETVDVEVKHKAQVGSESSLGTFGFAVSQKMTQMRRATNLNEFFQVTLAAVQQLTGFGRVMAYQFDDQGAGTVIAEIKPDHQPAYLGLHYPATDIPQPSRDLYQHTALRFIPDLKAVPVPLVPAENPVTHSPLDLSGAVLRAVDPCCTEFHDNMGSAALLVMSLMEGDRLWGLISCHHATPHPLPYSVRANCELLGQFANLELANKIQQEELASLTKLRAIQSDFVQSISQVENFREALVNPAPRLLDLVNAQGAAVCLDDEITLVGQTPTLEQVRSLIQWAETQTHEPLLVTDSLPKLWDGAIAYKDTASGLLMLRISQIQRYAILWFRPEVLQTVNWAGNPQDSIQVNADGSVRLSPRHSFERWQETVRFTSLPWQPAEQQGALDLRNAIVGIVLNRADELTRINQELAHSNRELDSFAFAASHDLKEPLRGIFNLGTILLEDYESVLDAEGMETLQTLLSLSRRMDTLITVLMQISQIGQAEPHRQPTNLNELLEDLATMLETTRPHQQFDLRVPRSLPIVECDTVLVSEVFSNLVNNALKYNDQALPWVEVGFLTPAEQNSLFITESIRLAMTDSSSDIFYVRDNGIGIPAHHHEKIFRLFKRLHPQENYGGGAGAGLAIAKRIVERHGGQIWVESTPGDGSTFFFTLR